MNFISISFLLFVFILVLIIYFVKNNKLKKVFILLFSIIFYGLFNVRFLIILLYIVLTSYYFYKHNSKKKLVFGIIFLLLPLFVFKYYNFFLTSFNNVMGINVNTLKIILPIGISFYTFQSLSLIIDRYNNKISDDYSFIDISFYLCFFPQLISGPIVKARDFLPQLKNNIIVNYDNISYGVQKFTWGVFKKTVLADRLAVGINAVYNSYSAYSGMSLFLAALAYSLQIYFDFSGYSDMAVGIAKIFGINLGKNFNIPYISKNLSEFWKRWHISLSSWFMEYVYIPLGGNKKGKIRSYINVIITMTISGLWHGADISFIFWGLVHGIGSVISKIFIKQYNVLCNLIKILLTYFFVTLMWIPFRINNFNDVISFVYKIVTFQDGINYINIYFIIIFICTILYNIYCYFKNNGDDIWKPLNLSKFSNKVLFILFILFILLFAYFGEGAFIYANF